MKHNLWLSPAHETSSFKCVWKVKFAALLENFIMISSKRQEVCVDFRWNHTTRRMEKNRCLLFQRWQDQCHPIFTQKKSFAARWWGHLVTAFLRFSICRAKRRKRNAEFKPGLRWGQQWWRPKTSSCCFLEKTRKGEGGFGFFPLRHPKKLLRGYYFDPPKKYT